MLIFRERERQHHRDELWLRVESLAQKSPAYEIVRPQLMIESSVAIPNNSPEQNNDDMSFEALEKEANEVS